MRTHVFPRRTPLGAVLLGVSFYAAWPGLVRAQGAPRRGSNLERSVDPAIKPGDDFFAYANGAWLAHAVIPAGSDRWSVRDEIAARSRAQVGAILDDARSAKAGSLARKVSDFEAALLDTSTIERLWLAPLAPILLRIDSIGDREGLARYLGRTMRADVDPLNLGNYTSRTVFGFTVEHSIHGETGYSAFLLLGGLGLAEPDDYLGNAPAVASRRARYKSYIATMLMNAGFTRAEVRADSVLAVETALAAAEADPEEPIDVDRNADHRWARGEFARRAPAMPWDAFFASAGLNAADTIVAWQPRAVAAVAQVVASRSLEAWKDYLRFHAVHDHVDVLPRRFAGAATESRGDARTRERLARDITQVDMAGAIGQLYAARYFSPAQKARVRRIVTNVTAAFREHVRAAPWLSPASRQIASAKIDSLYLGVGYPERWEDWTDLRVDPHGAFANVDRVAEREKQRALARLTRPYDRHEWVWNPQDPGAVLVFQQNAYTFAAALLQPPKYDSTASDAAMYGAIGAIFGHDVSHFVDVLGAQYQPDGEMRRWWTPDDSSRFEAAAEPLVRQFSAYEPLPGVHLDGLRTRTENVADLAGLTAAFEAYRKSLGARARDRTYVRRQDRAFFIAFAQAFGAKMTDAALRAQLESDHAPEMYRMNTVRNIDAWYDAFGIVPGQRLYLEPHARAHVW